MLGTVRNVPFGCFSFGLSPFILSSEIFHRLPQQTLHSNADLSSVHLMRSHLGGSAER